VRGNTPEVTDLLRRALRAHVVDEPDIAPNYSFQLGTPSPRGPGAPLNFVFRQCLSVLRTRSATRAFACLVRYLYERADDYADGLVPIDVMPLYRDGAVILVPMGLHLQLKKMQRQLEDEGFLVVDMPCAKLDPASGHLVVREPPVQVDPDAVDALVRLAGQDPAVGVIPPAGAYPVIGWLFLGKAAEARGTLDRLYELSQLVRSPDRVGAQTVLDTLAKVFDNGARSVPVDMFNVDSIRTAIRTAAQ